MNRGRSRSGTCRRIFDRRRASSALSSSCILRTTRSIAPVRSASSSGSSFLSNATPIASCSLPRSFSRSPSAMIAARFSIPPGERRGLEGKSRNRTREGARSSISGATVPVASGTSRTSSARRERARSASLRSACCRPPGGRRATRSPRDRRTSITPLPSVFGEKNARTGGSLIPRMTFDKDSAEGLPSVTIATCDSRAASEPPFSAAPIVSG